MLVKVGQYIILTADDEEPNCNRCENCDICGENLECCGPKYFWERYTRKENWKAYVEFYSMFPNQHII